MLVEDAGGDQLLFQVGVMLHNIGGNLLKCLLLLLQSGHLPLQLLILLLISILPLFPVHSGLPCGLVVLGSFFKVPKNGGYISRISKGSCREMSCSPRGEVDDPVGKLSGKVSNGRSDDSVLAAPVKT